MESLPAIPTTMMMTGFLLKLGDPFPIPEEEPSMPNFFIDSLSSSFCSSFAFKTKPLHDSEFQIKLAKLKQI